jgi:hypothetical protein
MAEFINDQTLNAVAQLAHVSQACGIHPQALLESSYALVQMTNSNEYQMPIRPVKSNRKEFSREDFISQIKKSKEDIMKVWTKRLGDSVNKSLQTPNKQAEGYFINGFLNIVSNNFKTNQFSYNAKDDEQWMNLKTVKRQAFLETVLPFFDEWAKSQKVFKFGDLTFDLTINHTTNSEVYVKKGTSQGHFTMKERK